MAGIGATRSGPTARSTTTTWAVLLLLAAAGWAVVLWQARVMDGMAPDGMPAATPLPLFLAVWLSMMVAMMFPAAAPVVSLFAATGRARRAAGGAPAPTWAFLAGYLCLWTLFGLAAYLVALAVPTLGMAAPGLRARSPLLGGIVLIAAGAYQVSPLKQVCLRHCRSPLSVLLHTWRAGTAGAWRMGAQHGAACVGCCWGLMLVLFAVGLMNLVAMLLLTAVIFAEKVLPHGLLVGRVAAVALLLVGALPLLGRLP